MRRSCLALLGVVLMMTTTACGNAMGSSSQASSLQREAARASTMPNYVAMTVPESQVGQQLTWFLSVANAEPLSPQVISAHFDLAFWGQVGPDRINSALEPLRSSASPKLLGVLVSEPTRLEVLVTFGQTRLTVSISVDGAGLIMGLLLSPYQPPPTGWGQLDQQLTALGPDVGFIAAKVSPTGACISVHQVNTSTTRPLGSMFKLFVLGALAHQVEAGRVSWNQMLTVTASTKSLGSIQGSLQYVPTGTQVSVLDTATKMISISDNTAADMLINLVGPNAVVEQVRQWTSGSTLDNPFFTTRELFLLHYVNFPALANEYLGLSPARRAAFLTRSVDPLSLSEVREVKTPRDVNSIEWFASPSELCRAFVGLQRLSVRPGLAPIGSILSTNSGGINLDRTQWPTIWFKGGSEPGVLTLGYLATASKGQSVVVVAMVDNPRAALSPSATPTLVALANGAFGLTG
jgi:hypothetical protein